jgi:sulfatase modifying factor 1
MRGNSILLSILAALIALLSVGCGGEATDIKSDKEAINNPSEGKSAQQEEITNSIGMKFRLIPAGSFMMGALPGDGDAGDNEAPQHQVEITKPFYISVYEVTQAEWQTIMGLSQDEIANGGDLWGVGPKYPVCYVSWDKALEFCAKLSEKDGVTYRLPTEAEWEYAARGGVEGKLYVWGVEKTPLVNGVKQANVADESIKQWAQFAEYKDFYKQYGYFTGYDDGYSVAAPVGSFAPNGFGLYDMAGNVWEWCSDWYGVDYYAYSPSMDPPGPDSGEFRVIRGGCWGDSPRVLRSSDRSMGTPGNGFPSLGFRIVREMK